MEKIIKLKSNDESIMLYGHLDENLRFAESKYNVKISARNNRLKIIGDDANTQQAYDFFDSLLEQYRSGKVTANSKKLVIDDAPQENQPAKKSKEKYEKPIFHRGQMVQAKSKAQHTYLKAIQKNDIVIAVGPAGTGKTYLAVAAAVDALKSKRVKRIILTRPAVEAGENLGFLPGDLAAKVNPYLRPLYDALYDMMDVDEVAKCIEREIIEIAPLAYMRGRTLNNAFVILDEGQNCLHSQMKMFLTRLGETSKMVITGDVTQIDLPRKETSGLVETTKILKGIKGIEIIKLDGRDVVRHKLVKDIIAAYDKFEI